MNAGLGWLLKCATHHTYKHTRTRTHARTQTRMHAHSVMYMYSSYILFFFSCGFSFFFFQNELPTSQGSLIGFFPCAMLSLGYIYFPLLHLFTQHSWEYESSKENK